MVSVADREFPLAAAFIIGLVVTATADVGIETLIELAPAGTVTVAGGAALGSVEVSATASPAAGAGPLKVIKAVDVWPPYTVVGESVRFRGLGGSITSVAVVTDLRYCAERTTESFEATGVVVIAKVAVVAPAGTVIEVGTVTEESLDDRETTKPPVGAG